MSKLQADLSKATQELTRKIVEGAQKTGKEISDLNANINKVSLKNLIVLNFVDKKASVFLCKEIVYVTSIK